MSIFTKISAWYERTYKIQIGIAAVLFILQLGHLIWLFGEVLWLKLFGYQLFTVSDSFQKLLIAFDYTEIPAIITSSLIYIHEYRKHKKFKDILYFFFIVIQLLHIFWITDEFVINTTTQAGTILPSWLAIVAIVIDYLELPVMFETCKKFFVELKKSRT